MQRGTIQTLMQLQLKGLLMRTIILYASRHHGNTKKLVDAIVEAHPEIDTLDLKSLGKIRQGYRWYLPHEAGHLYGCLRLPRL